MNLAARMTLDTHGFTNPLRSAQSAVAGSVTQMRSAFAGLASVVGLVGLSFAAFRSAEGIVGSIKAVAETGKELRTMSATTGTSIRDLVTLRKAFEEVGIGAEGVQPVLVKMQAAMGGVNEEGQPTAHIFQQIGLNLSALQKMGTVGQLEAISGAINNLSNQSQKAAAVRGIFGRGGAEMLALFANPEAIKEAGEMMAGQAAIYERSAARFAQITNTLHALSNKVKGFFVGLTDQITPVLLPMLEKLKKSFDSVQIGQKFGESIRVALAAYQNGELGELLGLSIQVGLEKSVPTIANTLLKAFKLPIAWLQAKLEALKDQTLSFNPERGAVAKAGGSITGAIANFFSGGTGPFAKAMTRDFQHLSDLYKLGGANLDKGSDANIQKRAAEIAAQGAYQIPVSPGATAAQTALTALTDKLKSTLKPLTDSLPKPTSPAGAPRDLGGSGAKLAEGDRFAKIGLFVGQGGPAHDYLRRTAVATEKLVGLLQGNQRSVGLGGFLPAPAWGS